MREGSMPLSVTRYSLVVTARCAAVFPTSLGCLRCAFIFSAFSYLPSKNCYKIEPRCCRKSMHFAAETGNSTVFTSIWRIRLDGWPSCLSRQHPCAGFKPADHEPPDAFPFDGLWAACTETLRRAATIVHTARKGYDLPSISSASSLQQSRLLGRQRAYAFPEFTNGSDEHD